MTTTASIKSLKAREKKYPLRISYPVGLLLALITNDNSSMYDAYQGENLTISFLDFSEDADRAELVG